jgi:hypothetical protein
MMPSMLLIQAGEMPLFSWWVNPINDVLKRNCWLTAMIFAVSLEAELKLDAEIST